MLLKTSLQLRGLPACVKKKEKYQIGCSKHKWSDSPTETSRQRHPDRNIPTDTSRQRHPDRDIPTETTWQRHPDRNNLTETSRQRLTDRWLHRQIKAFWKLIYNLFWENFLLVKSLSVKSVDRVKSILLPTTQIWFFFVYFNWDFDKFYAFSVFRSRIQRNSFMIELKF